MFVLYTKVWEKNTQQKFSARIAADCGRKEVRMKKKTKMITAIVIVIAVIAVFLGVYKVFGPKAQKGTKAYTV